MQKNTIKSTLFLILTLWTILVRSTDSFATDPQQYSDNNNNGNNNNNNNYNTEEHYSSTRSTFKAAVYAHVLSFPPTSLRPVSREEALKYMEVNLAVYRDQAETAREQGVDILAFPEDGLYGYWFTRETIYPYLEYMPDPNTEDWIPCDDPHRYNGSEIQVALSCLAKSSGLYLVANVGDMQPCDQELDPACPGDGRYQYNTNVAYGPDGQFLAKYHKYNLFSIYEPQFDIPATPTASYFDTPFGRFGLIVCNDLLFGEPTVTLVEQFNVTNMVFPTAWVNTLPLLNSLGFHSSFARAHGVNFLTSNVQLPASRHDGSGLYGPNGARAFYYGGDEPKLVVAEMDVITNSEARLNSGINSGEPQQENPSLVQDLNHTKSVFEENMDESKEFSSTLFADTYTFRTVDSSSGNLSVCQGKVCCHIEYVKAREGHSEDYSDGNDGDVVEELFAFGAFDGLHTLDGQYYMQNCVLIKCAEASDRTSCGAYNVTTSNTVFTKVKMMGQFETPYVYPQLLLSDLDGKIAISKSGVWTFDGSTLQTADSFNGTVLNAILLGRDYTRDSQTVVSSGSLVELAFSVKLSIIIVLAALFYCG